MKLNFINGRFQPFTKSHLAILLKSHKENKNTMTYILMSDKTPDYDNPLTFSERCNLLSKLIEDMKDERFTNIRLVKCYRNNFVDTVNYLIEATKADEYTLNCGPDRLKEYQKIVDNYIASSAKGKLICHDDLDDSIRASVARQAARDNDKEEFKRIVGFTNTKIVDKYFYKIQEFYKKYDSPAIPRKNRSPRHLHASTELL